MRFGKKLIEAIERGEWVRRRSWPKGLKMRKGAGDFFVDEEGFATSLTPTDIFATDWVIVRKKAKAPVAPKANGPRYEPIETMPVVGDKVEHPDDDGGGCPPLAVERILEAGDIRRWRVEAGGATCSLFKDGCGWRILKRRDVFTDPKPGDVIGKADATVEVRFADAEAVMLRWNSGPPTATSRETWAAYAASGWTVRKLGS